MNWGVVAKPCDRSGWIGWYARRVAVARAGEHFYERADQEVCSQSSPHIRMRYTSNDVLDAAVDA
jgi:hypothetical protein